jgi:ATP synthase F0 subunit b
MNDMDNIGLIAMVSIIIAGMTMAIGSIGPALGEARAVAQALSSIAQQPDASGTITRTLFVGLAMIESMAIYCFVVALILSLQPFWKYVIALRIYGTELVTVIAQIINFLILVALLKRFLYGPIIKAMLRREEEIAERLDEAANKKRAADEEGMRYRAMVQELADTREKMLAQAREEAEVLRRDLKQKAREETDKSQAQWHESFRQQREAFAQGLRLHACKQVFAVVRRALTDLADTDLGGE